MLTNREVSEANGQTRVKEARPLAKLGRAVGQYKLENGERGRRPSW